MSGEARGGGRSGIGDGDLSLSGFEAYLLDQVDAAVIATDLAGTIVHWNRHAELLYGRTRDEAIGRNILDTNVPPDLAEEASRILGVVRAGDRWEGAFPALRKDGSTFVGYFTLSPLRDADGALAGVAGVSVDITDAKVKEETERFLADAAALLSTSLDFEETIATLAELAVPVLADWCIVDLAEEGGTIRQLAVAHRDPGKTEMVRELRRRYPPRTDHPIARVIRSGVPVLDPVITDQDVEAAAVDAEHAAIRKALGTRSHMVVPLVARGRILGAISFVSSQPGRYSDVDLALAQDLASRAALALDNARLYRDAQWAAETAGESLAVLDTLLATAPVGIGFFDRDLRYVRLNDALAAMNGRSIEEHLGRRLHEVLPGLDPDVAEDLQRVLETGEPIIDRETSVETPAAPGRQRHWLASYYPVRAADSGIIGVGTVVTEITQRKETERRQAALAAVARVLAEAATLAEATPEILRAVGESLDWDLGALWTIDADQGVLRCVDLWRAERVGAPEFERATRTMTFLSGVGLPGRVWASARPAWIMDVTRDDNFPRAPIASREGLHGAFAFPILMGFEVRGVMEFFSERLQEPDPDLLAMVAGIGGQIGQFVERKLAEESVRRSEARKTAILESAIDCVVSMDHTGAIVEFNPAAERVLGYARDEVLGRPVGEVMVPEHLRDLHRKGLANYMATGESVVIGRRVELVALRRDGTEFPVELAVTRVDLPGPPLFTAYIRDITERREAEESRARLLEAEQRARAQAEDVRHRLLFLAEASQLLSSSLDYRATLAKLANLAVPRLADWCSIDVVEQDGSIRQLAVAHVDPEKARWAEEYRRRNPVLLDAPYGVGRVLRTGRSELVPALSEEFIDGAVQEPDQLDMVRSLSLRSFMCVPLSARGRILGAISFVQAESGGRYGPPDLALAEDLARRAAQAVDNAQLYEERSYVARTLQQSLLPPQLPDIPGLDVSARYHAAGEGNEVGGDFYDVFDTGDGGWGVVIGDVCGRGADAAALTGLARYTLRAAAMRDRRPSRILATLNEAILLQRSDYSFCTVCYTRLMPNAEGARLTVATGGHPLPLVLRGDGRVEEAGSPGTLLGVFPDPELTDRVVELGPGDSIVFYTDGVTEAQSEGRMYGEDRLRAALSPAAGLDAGALARRIESDVLEFQPDAPDDIAILVLRISV